MSSWRLLFQNVRLGLSVLGLAAICSFLPVAVNNFRYCGDWTGQAAENVFSGNNGPALLVTRGSLLLIVQNLTPPVLPLASKVESTINQALPERMTTWFKQGEPYAGWGRISIREMVAEEDAGFGFGLVMLLLAQIVGSKILARSAATTHLKRRIAVFCWLIPAATFVSLMVFLSKSGLTTAARTVIPYYALLLPCCLGISGLEVQVRRRWWKIIGVLVFLAAGLAVVVIPERPLWPALTVLKKLSAGGKSPGVARALTVYETYRGRSEVLSPLVEALPPGVNAVGLIGVTEPEASLWRPFGSRRIYHILADTKPEDCAGQGVEWVIVNEQAAKIVLNHPLADWLKRFDAEVKQVFPIRVFASGALDNYLLVRIKPEPGAKKPAAAVEK